MGRALIAICLLATAALPGCFDHFLDEHRETKMGFVCRALDPSVPMWIEVWGAPPGSGAMEGDASLASTDPITAHLAIALAEGLQRPMAGIRYHADVPADLGAFLKAGFQDRTGIHLHILWVDALDQPDRTGSSPGPGTIMLSRLAATEGAARLDRPVEDIAGAMSMHHAGHALGLVNKGVPVQNPAIQEREGGHGHARQSDAVMAEGWQDVRTMAWHGPYAYSDADRADWAGARDGVCP